ncbi:hypothetical protein FRX31_005718, partial [Thalictrum thalictroides]
MEKLNGRSGRGHSATAEPAGGNGGSYWPKQQVIGLGSYIWKILPYGIMWCVWTTQKEAVFQDIVFSVEAAILRTKATLWAWFVMKPESLKER